MNISLEYSPAPHINLTTPTILTYIPNHATTQTTPQPIQPTTINHTSTQYEPNQSNNTTQTPQPPPQPPTTHTNTQTTPTPITTTTSSQTPYRTTSVTTQTIRIPITMNTLRALGKEMEKDRDNYYDYLDAMAVDHRLRNTETTANLKTNEEQNFLLKYFNF
jgi:hypothetical protein